MQQIHADTFDMQIWLIESWTGTPVNVALDEHDAIAWFQEDELGELRLAHDSYLATYRDTKAPTVKVQAPDWGRDALPLAPANLRVRAVRQ